jgi:hypothetical protein
MARAKKPAAAAAPNSSGVTVPSGAHSNDWISASGEAHGNGFSASGGSFNGSGETHGSFSVSGGTHSLPNSFTSSGETHSGHERLIPHVWTGFGRTDLAGKSPADLKTLFDQLSLLKGHGFTADELRAMPADVVAQEYAQAVREGATADERMASVHFPWWRADPLFQDGGPIAKLLMGLSRSRRDNDDALLSQSETLDFIGFFIGWYSAEDPDRDLWQQIHKQTRDELDRFHKKIVELIADTRASYELYSATSIEDTLATLEGVAGVVAAKRKRLVKKRGPKTKSSEFVVAIIQTIEEYTGTKVERSSKRGTPADVVRTMIKIMNPAIGSGTIDEALRAQSKAFGEIKRRKR